MPYPYLTELPIWIATCTQQQMTGEIDLDNGADDNSILQVLSGRCTVTCNGEHRVLVTRSVLFLGRDTRAEITGDADQPCRYILLVYSNAHARPYMDLNRLCLNAPLVDSFFAQKTRFCTLEDRTYINMTLGEIRYEWENSMGESETAIRAAMENLFVKLARAFHTTNRFSGVSYLTAAKNIMYRHFQQRLTVETIAGEVGISRSYLEALFNRYMRGSIVDYLHAVRCDHAAQLLTSTRFPIIDIALDSGFNNRQHFSRVFREIYGSTPSEFRKRNRRVLKRPR
jgi:AraC-like DNA-binding protein